MEGEVITGSMVKAHIDALRPRLGARWDAVLAALTPAQREELTLVTPLSWVKIESTVALYTAASAEIGVSVEVLHTDIASVVIGKTITTLWRALLPLASDEALIRRSPTLFKRAYRQGRLEVVDTGRGFADLRVVAWPDMNEFALRGLRVGIESTLRHAGRRNVRGSSRRSRDGAELRFDWST